MEACCIRGPKTRMHECFRDAYTTLSLLARMFPCCKSWWNISSRSCHWALWAALRWASVAETHACMFIHTRMHYNSDTETVICNDAFVAYTIVQSVLLRRTSSLNDRRKLKGECIAVKCRRVTSVGTSLNPHSLS